MRISSATLILACALSFAPLPAAAQSITGTIVGRVTDPSDAVIVGANVRAINAATDATDSTTTNDSGFYRIPHLLPGEYFVEVEAPGFQTKRVSAQRLSLADNLRLDVPLELGQAQFSVTVEGRASEVNTEDAQLGKVMRDIARLPVLSTANGRNVLELAYTQPGTVPAEAGVYSGIAVNGLGRITMCSTGRRRIRRPTMRKRGQPGVFHPMPSRSSAWSRVPPRPSTAEVPEGR